MHQIKQITIPVLVAVTGLLSMSLIAQLLQNGRIPLWIISPYKIVNLTLTMQILVLPISFIALGGMYLYNKEAFTRFFRPGLTLPRDNQWRFLGPILAGLFTIGIALLMSVAVTSQHGRINASFTSLLPLVLLFAATNAWSEEIFSRFVIVAGLDGKINPHTICWISAVIFGVPHFFGTPSGVSGVIMSGLLGWILAKSVIETRGLGWALFIHFLQDLVIFGAGAMIVAGQAP